MGLLGPGESLGPFNSFVPVTSYSHGSFVPLGAQVPGELWGDTTELAEDLFTLYKMLIAPPF